MKDKSTAIIIVLVLIIGYLLYDKASTGHKIIPVQQSTPAVKDIKTYDIKTTKERECMLAAENFFEVKRSQEVDLYSATWNETYDESSGNCYIQIQGNIYDVKTGELITTRQTAR